MDKKYLASRVATANDAGLVVLLYEGLIDCLKDAKDQVQKRDDEVFEKNIEKIKDILTELLATLNGDSEIASKLRCIYGYVYKLITDGVIKKEQNKFEEAIKVVTPLYDAWIELEKQEFEKNKNKSNSNRPEIIAGATYGKGQLNNYVVNNENRWRRG